MANSILTVSNLTVSFDGFKAVDDLNFSELLRIARHTIYDLNSNNEFVKIYQGHRNYI